MAISQITSNSIAAGAVSASDLADGSITADKLSTGHPTWDSSGNVGVGTSSVNGKLNILTTQNYAGLDIRDNNYYLQATPSSLGGMALVTGNNPLIYYINSAERMRIDSSGRVTAPYQPHLIGSPGTGTEGSSGNANRIYIRNNVGFSVSSGTVTVPVQGIYLICWQTICQSSTSGRYDTSIKINDVTVSSGLNEENGNGYHQRTHSMSINLAANDNIKFYSGRFYSTGDGYSEWNIASISLLN